MKNILLIAIIASLIFSCTEGARAGWFPPVEKRVLGITYVKDTRTNLCFVANSVMNANAGLSDVFTNVPCTPDVEKLIK